jgi:sec-independent protein translocase protein TatC
MEQSGLMTIREHLDDLKSTFKYILYTFIGFFILGCVMSSWLLKEIVQIFTLQPYALKPFEYINAQISISLVIAFIGSMPFIIYNIVKFLKDAELGQNIRKYMIFSTLLGYAGFAFGAVVLSKYGLEAMQSINPSYITNTWGIYSIISFIGYMGLGMALAIQTVILVPIIIKSGIINIKDLSKNRKYVFFTLFVLAGMITPPDPITIFIMAIPLYLCFEIGLLMSYITNKEVNQWQSERQNGLSSQV